MHPYRQLSTSLATTAASLMSMSLVAVTPGMDYDQTVAAGLDALEYIQAAGRADAVASGPVQDARVEPAPTTGV